MWRSNNNYEKIKKALKSGKDLVVFDTETTGLSTKTSYIIEFAGKKYRNINGKYKPVDSVSVYIKPPVPVSSKIEELTGITNKMLDEKLPEEVVFPQIESFLEDCVWIVYNEKFDVPMVLSMAQRMHSRLQPFMTLDALDMARDLVPKSQTKSHKLCDIAELYHVSANIEGLAFHDATYDAEVTAKLFFVFCDEYVERAKQKSTVPLMKTKVTSICPWKKGRMQRIYVNTEHGTIYYNLMSKSWEDKDLSMEQFDMNDILCQVLCLSGVECEETLYKLESSIYV